MDAVASPQDNNGAADEVADDGITNGIAEAVADAVAGNVFAPTDTTRARRPSGRAGHTALDPGVSVAPKRRTGAASSVERVPYEEDALANFYATELRVAMGLTARMGGDSDVSGGCVHGARVVVILEAFDPVVTW